MQCFSIFATISLLSVALSIAGGARDVESRQPSEGDMRAGNNTLVYIGTYTGAQSKGIYVFRLQSAGAEVFQNVTLVPRGFAAETQNPSFLELDLKQRPLFAVNEIDG